MTDIRSSTSISAMTHVGQKTHREETLLGLSVEETREFVRLDELASRLSADGKRHWSTADERRWLELFEKKHAAAMQPFLTRKDS